MMQMQQIYTRIPDAASVSTYTRDTPGSTQPLKGLTSIPASSLTWSEDGSLLAVISQQGVTIREGENLAQAASLHLPNIVAIAFSPKNTYLTTFQRPQPGAGNAEKNLKVWRWREQSVAMQLFQKSYSRDTWPAISFTGDEGSALHLVTNAVNIYDPANFPAGVQKKLGLKGVGGFAVSQNAGAIHLAAYVPEGKGAPGFVGVWPLGQLSKAESPPPVARRSFFRATYAKLTWNAPGTGLLALTATDTDATNQSYYGEQKLSFLSADGTNDCLVQLKEGPVHDVQWTRAGDYFAVVAGFMPARTTLFSASCKAVFDLGSGPHNLVRWSPQGRFLALAGFGNLPGDVVFFDRKSDGRCKQMGAVRAENGVSLDWSPDGRHLLTATTAPRLRVDNGYQMYRYTGEKLLDERVPVLLEAGWRPAPQDAFPDLPQSPRTNGSTGSSAPPAVPQRAAGYVAPHLRGSGASSSGNFSLAHDSESSRGRLGLDLHHQRLVPGAAPPESKTSSKNAKRRGRAKGKSVEDVNGEEAETAPHEAKPAGALSEEVQSGMASMSVTGGQQGDGQDAAADSAKRLRNLQKKLRQVQQLKEKQGKGETLEPEQVAKIGSEAGLHAEIEALGG